MIEVVVCVEPVPHWENRILAALHVRDSLHLVLLPADGVADAVPVDLALLANLRLDVADPMPAYRVPPICELVEEYCVAMRSRICWGFWSGIDSR